MADMEGGPDGAALVRSLTRSLIDDARSFTLRSVAAEVEEQIGELPDHLVRRYVRMGILHDVRNEVASHRSLRPVAGRTMRGVTEDTRLLNTETQAKAAGLLASRWGRWYEFSGLRHIRLADMTKHDLLSAAKLRRTSAESNLRRAELLEQLAEELADGQTIGQRYTAEDIDAIARSVGVLQD